jgi:NodT family efflux transporter outer membrane factor (OMF) lipoprotein
MRLVRRRIRRSAALVIGVLLVALAASCAVGPNYRKPAVDMPPAWQAQAMWREGVPDDAALKGEWWRVFHDPVLEDLVKRALANNQTLLIAAARLDQARAEVTLAQADFFPQLGLNGAAARNKTSANRPSASYGIPSQSTVQNDFKLNAAVSYEADLFGRVRRAAEGARASEQQAQAEFENTRLLLTAQLLTDYFSLRELDAETEVVRQSVASQRHALDVVTARHDLGFATGLDLAQQEALLDASATQLELLKNQRAQQEHAIATLVAVPAPSFSLEADAAPPTVVIPALPLGVPSDLLQRRPDIAAAERAMAAANARIGVARSAYFPSIELLPSIGWESTLFSSLISAPSRVWSAGLSATQTVFDAGRTRARVRIATADYSAAVADYRETVLTAMEEVQNGIVGLESLRRAAVQADAGVESAQRALDIANDRYGGGVATYLDVITAQQTLLTDQRQAAQIRGQQFLTAVYLVKALGGGWSGS